MSPELHGYSMRSGLGMAPTSLVNVSLQDLTPNPGSHASELEISREAADN